MIYLFSPRILIIAHFQRKKYSINEPIVVYIICSFSPCHIGVPGYLLKDTVQAIVTVVLGAIDRSELADSRSESHAFPILPFFLMLPIHNFPTLFNMLFEGLERTFCENQIFAGILSQRNHCSESPILSCFPQQGMEYEQPPQEE